MKSIIATILDAYHRLVPDTNLLSHENLCLEAWKNELSDELRRTLNAQLSAAYFVQRQAMGAKVCFYYPVGKEIALFQDQSPNIHAATVTLKSSGGSKMQQMDARIFVHRGRLFSIEFPKRPERYWEQHSMKALPLEVSSVEIRCKLEASPEPSHS